MAKVMAGAIEEVGRAEGSRERNFDNIRVEERHTTFSEKRKRGKLQGTKEVKNKKGKEMLMCICARKLIQ